MAPASPFCMDIGILFSFPFCPSHSLPPIRRLALLGRAGIVGKEAGRKWKRWAWGKGRRWLVQWLAGWVTCEIGWEWRYLIPSYYLLTSSLSTCLQSIFVHSFRVPLPISYLGCVLSPCASGSFMGLVPQLANNTDRRSCSFVFCVLLRITTIGHRKWVSFVWMPVFFFSFVLLLPIARI